MIFSVLGDLFYLSIYNFRFTNLAVIVSVPKLCLCFIFCYKSNYFPNLIVLLCFFPVLQCNQNADRKYV